MVVFNDTKINKQLEEMLGIARKKVAVRNKGGLYTRIKKKMIFVLWIDLWWKSKIS